MFNLEQSITEWRQRMLAAGVKTPVPFEELESHLRDEIERNLRLGQSESEAFEAAVQTIGPARAVQSEFEKFEALEDAHQWKHGQIWFGTILGLLQLVVIASVLFNSYMTFGQRMSGLAAIGTSMLLVGFMGLIRRRFPVIWDGRTRTVVGFVSGVVPAVVWSLIAAQFLLVGHEYPFGQWLASVLWTTCPPLAVCLGIIMGFETAARKEIEANLSASHN